MGKSINAEFKNPFFEPVEFSIRFDSPSFTSGTKSPLRIDAKKGVAISVTYKPVAGYEGTGRLIISAGDLPPWIYYLQGE